MAKPLSILYVTNEAYPFSREGETADISYSFALSERAIGHDIRIMTPKYGGISERKNKIHEINRLRDVPIPVGENSFPATVKSSSVNSPRYKVQAYVTTSAPVFDAQKGFYSDPKTYEPFVNNAERFAFFARSVVQTCVILGWFPDIIHCNNWQTGLVPMMARLLFPAKFKKTKFVFSFNKFHEHGSFPNAAFPLTGMPAQTAETIKYKNHINFLKAGIVYSNYVSCYSENYAPIALSERKSGALSQELKAKEGAFKGVTIGLDEWQWNAAHDELLVHNYDSDFQDFKYNNKVAILRECGLTYDPKAPLLICPFSQEEFAGWELILDNLSGFIKENFRLVVYGKIPPAMAEKFNAKAAKHPTKLAVKLEPDESFTHRIIAGADASINAREVESTAYRAKTALVYGALPIARLYGANLDACEQVSPELRSGNCFGFKKYTGEEFVSAVKAALSAYKNRELWNDLSQRAFDGDYTWGASAEQFDEIYRSIVKD